MGATIARRIFVRPELDEPCPDWARPLIPLACQQGIDGLGIDYERVPQETASALQDLFPTPSAPKRQRKREMAERRYKPYVKTWAAAVYFACLPFALAKQGGLLSGPQDGGHGDVAVLCFRGLADLATKLGLSYDRLQKWMSVLLILGFVKRYRDGRQVLYVLPMTAYIPAPSPKAVLKKLNALIESQYAEEFLPDGRVVWRDRCPEWTSQLIAIRTRFELRYQLTPTVPLGEAQTGQIFQTMLHQVSEAIPEALRYEVMERLFPILAQSYPDQARSLTESTSASARPLVQLRGESGEDEQRAKTVPRSRQNLDIATPAGLRAALAGDTESTFGAQNPHLAGLAGDGQSRFDGAHSTQSARPGSPASLYTSDDRTGAKVDSVADLSLTLRCNNSNTNFLKDNTNVNVGDAESQLKAANRKKAEILADLLRVPGNVNFYTKLFNKASRGELGEDLVKAIFIYTLHQEQQGEITDPDLDALGKYFFGVYKRWSTHRTYSAACQAYRQKWHSRTPQGIRPRDQAVIEPYLEYGYHQIADMIRGGVRAQEAGWLPFTPSTEVPEHPMDEQEAEALVGAIREQAAWYLQDPCCRRVLSGETVFSVVDAWQDDQPYTFSTPDQWQALHEQMLTPSEHLDLRINGMAGEGQEAAHAKEPGEPEGGDLVCARAALALFTYFNRRTQGRLLDLDWEALASRLPLDVLVKLGEPIRSPSKGREQPGQEAYPGPVAHEGLNVELEGGRVLTYEQFQALLAAGEYIELEVGEFIPRRRYDELLAAGEYVELDDGTPVFADHYRALEERARAEREREEAAESNVEVAQDEQLEQPGSARATGEMPGWLEELSLGLFESDEGQMGAEEVWQCRVWLLEALDPQLYRLLARPARTESALSFTLELTSLCSGWSIELEKVSQVERLLDLLRGQGGAEGEDQER